MKRLVNDFVARNVFTTGEVAMAWSVSPRTVTKMTDRKNNVLPSYRIGGDRRIPRDTLIAFMKRNGMPLFYLEDPSCPRILFVSVSKDFSDLFSHGGFEVRRAPSAFEAGLELRGFLPAVIVLDYDFCPDADLLCKKMREYSTQPIVIGIGLDSGVLHEHSDSFVKKTLTAYELLEIDVGRLLTRRYVGRRV